MPTYVAWIAAYLIARSRVQPHRTAPTSVRQTVLSAERERLPGGIVGALGPFLILGMKAVYAHLHWNEIPNRFPVHWGFNGPDRWVDRTPMAVFGSIGAIGAICALHDSIVVYRRHLALRKFRAGPPLGQCPSSQNSDAWFYGLAYVFAIALPPN